MAHTPGTWYAIYNDERIAKQPHWSVECHWPDTIAIAPFIRDAYKEGEAEANAKLIAAAPDLLEALERLVHLHLCEQEGLSSGQPSPEDWHEAVERASQAINKASL